MEATLTELLDHVPVFVRRREGEILYWTNGCRELYGYTTEEACGQPASELLRTVFPVPWETIEAALSAQGQWSGRLRQTCKSGREIWVEAVLRLRDSLNPGGPIIVEEASDISARVTLEEQSALLARELDHRVRNILTVVQALARMSVPDAPPEQLRKLEGRIAALAEANKLLHQSSWKQAELRGIVSEVAGTLGIGERIALDGPDVAIVADHAFGLSLALHELSTNALKYGALSDPAGLVALSWTVDGETEAVHLRWRERGGPPVAPPSRRGFGSRLIQGAVLGAPAPARIEYAPDGLVCDLYLKTIPAKPGGADAGPAATFPAR